MHITTVVSCWNGYLVNSKISMCIQLFEPPWIPVCFCGHFYRSPGPDISSFVALKRKKGVRWLFSQSCFRLNHPFHFHFTQKQQTLNPFHTAIATRSHGRLQVGPPDPPFLMHAASVKQSPSRRGVTARSRFALWRSSLCSAWKPFSASVRPPRFPTNCWSMQSYHAQPR